MNNTKKTQRPTNALLSDVWTSNFGQIMNEILHEPRDITHYIPKINLLENENGYVLQAAMPGIAKAEVSLAIEDGILKLTTSRTAATEKDTTKRHIAEIYTGEYKRAIRLPKNADTQTTEASLEDGILNVRFAKKKDSLPKQIEIK